MKFKYSVTHLSCIKFMSVHVKFVAKQHILHTGFSVLHYQQWIVHILVFWLHVISKEHSASIFSILITEAVCPSKKLVSTYQATQCHNPKDNNTNCYHHKNLKSHTKTQPHVLTNSEVLKSEGIEYKKHIPFMWPQHH
jgi:hypothetical protein